MTIGKSERNSIFILVLVAIVLRLPTLLFNYINIDETDLSLGGQLLLQGSLPYKDFLIYQPPVIYCIYALGFWLSGGMNLWAVHLITIAFASGTALTLYALIRSQTASQKAGLAAGLAYAIYSALFIPQDMLAANCEILMMLFLTLGTYFCLNSSFFLCGLFLGLGVLTKYQGGIVLLAALAYLPLNDWLQTGKISFRKTTAAWASMIFGFAIPFALMLGHLYYHGAWQQTIETFQYILLYSQNPPQTDWIYLILKFFIRTILFSLTSLPIWIGAIAAMRSPKEKPATLFFILWFCLSFLAIIQGGRIYFHYYFIILPAVCALFGIWWNKSGAQISKRAWTLAMTWLAICAVGWESYFVYAALHLHPKETWMPAAKYLKQAAKPGDTMFVWGLCYQLHFFSSILPGTRFTSADYLTGRFPMTAGLEYDPQTKNPPSPFNKLWHDFVDRPGVIIYDTSKNVFWKAWDYFNEDIEKRGLPTYIVDTSASNYRRYGRYPITNYPYLDDLLRKNYKKIDAINGYDIYLRK